MMNNVFNTILKSKIPGERSLILGEDSSNYYNLYKSIELISEVLIRRKCKRYDRVGICLEHGLNYIASLFATRRTDSIGVLYSPDWTISEFSRIQAHSQSRFIISTELDEVRKEINELRDHMHIFERQMQETAKSEEVKVLEKYINLWEPLNFVTRKEVKKVVKEILDKEDDD